MENVIITGGSGLLALNWAFFKKKDTQITLLLHNRKVFVGGVNSIFINLELEIEIHEFLSKKQECVVIHCAALTNVDYCEKNSSAAFETNVFISKKWQECNWAQSLEGGIDTAHLSFLDHRQDWPLWVR